MRYGSCCSGIEAASTAWTPLGWQPQFFAEIEPFPCAILQHYHPTVPNHGDLTKFKDWPDHAIDLLVSGTPCQSFSGAGLREGLDDPRGQLMLTYGHVAARYRPRWLVWENVPGVFSVDGGEAFASLLGLLSGTKVSVPANGWQNAGIVEGYRNAYGLAWRVLDAQFVRTQQHPFAVPQRRRRVFVVGYLGDWRRAAAVLFERESMRGDPTPRREAGKGITHPFAPSLTSSGRGVERAGVTRGQDPVIAVECGDIVPQAMSRKWSKGSSGPAGDEVANLVACSLTQKTYADNESRESLLVAHTLKAEGHDASEDGTGRRVPLVPVAFRAAGQNGFIASDVSPPIAASDGGGSGVPTIAFNARQDPIHSAGAALPLDTDGSTQAIVTEDVANTLRAGPTSKASHGKQSGTDRDTMVAVAFQTRIARNGRGQPEEVYPALNGSNAGETSDMRPCVATRKAVRRLTPLECERLMGFPDQHTAITIRKKPAKDGPRYKALGNSKAINVVEWIGQRIAIVDTL
jgi:DNA (cytosine-5)-methyltransferase 1